MAKGKAKTVVIKMLSAAGTGFFYTTTKNPRNVTRKLSLRKVHEKLIQLEGYDPIVRQHVIFNETKIKKG
ncbi:Ribosomal protein L33 [Phytophthora palmivora]|uniref:Ribosomal protein L33 n=1 Tax=Phytophthora palmivora TaxID=4796 RepID=A0A2P4YPG9_9STRA|nr:Ribosomal protein L33 [Phytophthora palmivora]